VAEIDLIVRNKILPGVIGYSRNLRFVMLPMRAIFLRNTIPSDFLSMGKTRRMKMEERELN
jgi:hypothetical protein